jgi:hypothetical protein
MTGQSTAAADRSASITRTATSTTREPYVWPVRSLEYHLQTALKFHEFRVASHARRGGEFVVMPESVLALEVVRLRKENAGLRAQLANEGSFW